MMIPFLKALLKVRGCLLQIEKLAREGGSLSSSWADVQDYLEDEINHLHVTIQRRPVLTLFFNLEKRLSRSRSHIRTASNFRNKSLSPLKNLSPFLRVLLIEMKLLTTVRLQRNEIIRIRSELEVAVQREEELLSEKEGKRVAGVFRVNYSEEYSMAHILALAVLVKYCQVPKEEKASLTTKIKLYLAAKRRSSSIDPATLPLVERVERMVLSTKDKKENKRLQNSKNISRNNSAGTTLA